MGAQKLERPTGLEPVSPAWEAGAQPIYQGRYNRTHPTNGTLASTLSLPSANDILQCLGFSECFIRNGSARWAKGTARATALGSDFSRGMKRAARSAGVTPRDLELDIENATWKRPPRSSESHIEADLLRLRVLAAAIGVTPDISCRASSGFAGGEPASP